MKDLEREKAELVEELKKLQESQQILDEKISNNEDDHLSKNIFSEKENY